MRLWDFEACAFWPTDACLAKFSPNIAAIVNIHSTVNRRRAFSNSLEPAEIRRCVATNDFVHSRPILCYFRVLMSLNQAERSSHVIARTGWLLVLVYSGGFTQRPRRKRMSSVPRLLESASLRIIEEQLINIKQAYEGYYERPLISVSVRKCNDGWWCWSVHIIKKRLKTHLFRQSFRLWWESLFTNNGR